MLYFGVILTISTREHTRNILVTISQLYLLYKLMNLTNANEEIN